MKFSILSVALLATSALAVPFEEKIECSDLVGGPAAFIKDMELVIHELEKTNNVTLLSDEPKTPADDKPGETLEKRQLDIITQAGCYTVCDRGPDVLKDRVCRFLFGPYRVACYSAALALRTPFGKRNCRKFCNIFD